MFQLRIYGESLPDARLPVGLVPYVQTVHDRLTIEIGKAWLYSRCRFASQGANPSSAGWHQSRWWETIEQDAQAITNSPLPLELF